MCYNVIDFSKKLITIKGVIHMKVLVIGGAGYIGSHAVRELVKEGNDVVVLDALYTGHRKAVDPKAKFYQGDIEDTFLV